jgi:hypothetical protein
VGRLDELAHSLAKELVQVGKPDDPLLYFERKGYLVALGRVLSGVEEARVVLARALQRLEEGRAGVTRGRSGEQAGDFACTGLPGRVS